jgi:hypothetical protein
LLTKFKSMENELKLLQSKLRRPIHITYISEHILKKDLDETRKIINSLVSDGFIVESESAKDYFSIK